MTTLPGDRDVFEIRIQVKPENIDDLKHVNNVVYLQWVQDVASAHWNHAAGPALIEACNWVVLKHEISYYSPARADDELIAATWIDAPEGPRQVRHVSIRRATDGKVLASAKTTWCLLDPATARPKRISIEISEVLGLKN